jgi:hypothetical protein
VTQGAYFLHKGGSLVTQGRFTGDTRLVSPVHSRVPFYSLILVSNKRDREVEIKNELQLGSYAVHQFKDGWEVIAPSSSDDPCGPAYQRVAIVREYGWRAAGRGVDGPGANVVEQYVGAVVPIRPSNQDCLRVRR